MMMGWDLVIYFYTTTHDALVDVMIVNAPLCDLSLTSLQGKHQPRVFSDCSAGIEFVLQLRPGSGFCSWLFYLGGGGSLWEFSPEQLYYLNHRPQATPFCPRGTHMSTQMGKNLLLMCSMFRREIKQAWRRFLETRKIKVFIKSLTAFSPETVKRELCLPRLVLNPDSFEKIWCRYTHVQCITRTFGVDPVEDLAVMDLAEVFVSPHGGASSRNTVYNCWWGDWLYTRQQPQAINCNIFMFHKFMFIMTMSYISNIPVVSQSISTKPEAQSLKGWAEEFWKPNCNQKVRKSANQQNKKIRMWC